MTILQANANGVNAQNGKFSGSSTDSTTHIDARQYGNGSGLLDKALVTVPASEKVLATDEPKQPAEKQAPAAAATVTWTHYVEAAESLGYSFRLNDLSNKVEVSHDKWLPNGGDIDDVAEARLLSELHALQLKNVDVARRAFMTKAAQSRFHPVKEYLEGLEWDGADHIAALSSYFPDVHETINYDDGTTRTIFHAFFRRWLVGAVAKVHDPHKGQNAMLILDGAQGKGKSYFVNWLCPLKGLHIEAAIKPEDKDYLENLTTKWIWEVGELGATIRKADREALKAFLTLQEATYRPAYGRYTVRKPALASCIGTVNMEQGFLNDPTGNRRFWPLTLQTINWDYITNIKVYQVWAQAYALYKQGEPWALYPEERAAHAQLCTLYEIEDPYVDRVIRNFDIVPANRLADEHTKEDWFMSTAEIADHLIAVGGVRANSLRALQMELATTMQLLGIAKGTLRTTPLRRGYVGIRIKTGQVGGVR